jgi:hypothetical protein
MFSKPTLGACDKEDMRGDNSKECLCVKWPSLIVRAGCLTGVCCVPAGVGLAPLKPGPKGKARAGRTGGLPVSLAVDIALGFLPFLSTGICWFGGGLWFRALEDAEKPRRIQGVYRSWGSC